MRSLADRWRVQAYETETGLLHGGRRVELRSEGDSEFDELVVGNGSDPAWFHMEQMDERNWWFAFYIDDDRRVCGNVEVFHTKPNRVSFWTEFVDGSSLDMSRYERHEYPARSPHE